jgi:hypothetical protein
MKVFEFIQHDCYLFTWENKGTLVTQLQADKIAIDLLANGLITIQDFPLPY